MPKTPELNGLAKRMNRTIMERVRIMLAHARLFKMFWVEALMINRSPSVPLDGDIPQRVWSDKDVSYRHLRVFSCLAYVHIVKDQSEILDPKTLLILDRTSHNTRCPFRNTFPKVWLGLGCFG